MKDLLSRIKLIHRDVQAIRITGQPQPEIQIVFVSGEVMNRFEFLAQTETDCWFELAYQYLNQHPELSGDFIVERECPNYIKLLF